MPDHALAAFTAILDRFSAGEFDLIEAGARIQRVVARWVSLHG